MAHGLFVRLLFLQQKPHHRYRRLDLVAPACIVDILLFPLCLFPAFVFPPEPLPLPDNLLILRFHPVPRPREFHAFHLYCFFQLLHPSPFFPVSKKSCSPDQKKECGGKKHRIDGRSPRKSVEGIDRPLQNQNSEKEGFCPALGMQVRDKAVILPHNIPHLSS